LRPTLVRGYHYELLPREIYFALMSWHGEVTPNICRRVMMLNIYEKNNREAFVNNMKALGILLYPQPSLTTNGSSNGAKITPDSISGVSHCGACQAYQARLRCTQCMSVQYCDRSCQRSHWPFHKLQCKPVSPSLVTTSRNTIVSYPSHGRVGLRNLGNTCFMNAARKCCIGV
jgi:ubiquitin carboxyl-terminal hydrolase 4/11